jgi:lysophospholipase L1-like esterase
MGPSAKKTWVFAAVAVTGSLLLLEGIARLLLPVPGNAPYEEQQRLVKVLGLPALNDILEFDRDLFWRLKPELRGFRVQGRIREVPIDFRVTTHAGFRSASPIEAPKRRFRVLALGDSCTFGLGVQDAESWPAQLEGLLQVSGLDVEVVNAGVPGYTAYQGWRVLETRGLTLEPDAVLVTFGFNDAEGMTRSDFETAEALSRRGATTVLSRSRLAGALGALVARPEPAGPKRPRLDENQMVEALDGIKRLCDPRGIDMILVIWPYEAQIRKRVPDYVLHQRTLARFCQERGVEGVDLINAFLRAGGPLFLDEIHADARGCRKAAEALVPWVSDHAARSPRL